MAKYKINIFNPLTIFEKKNLVTFQDVSKIDPAANSHIYPY